MVLRCENVSDGLLSATVSTYDLVISSRVPSQILALLIEFGGSCWTLQERAKENLAERQCNAGDGPQMSN